MNTEDFLEHHGIKGQKWGIRHDPLKALSEHEHAILNAAGINNNSAKKMAGNSQKTKHNYNLSAHEKQELKDALVGAGVLVAGGAAVFALHRFGQRVLLESIIGDAVKSKNFTAYFKESQKLKLSAFDISKLSTEPLTLSKGSILTRISTEAETTIKPGGFFAAHNAEDVDRYKAVLPIYWKLWGYSAKEGHVIRLEAQTAIKAPSEKESFDIFHKMLDKPKDPKDLSKGLWRDEFDSNKLLADMGLPESLPHEPTAKIAARVFRGLEWTDNMPPVTTAYLNELKSKGYNAVIDINDSGNLASSPLRVFSGADFKIVKTEKLAAEHIKEAQNAVLKIKHAIIMNTEDFLEHHGVKGQKWGIQNISRQHQINKASRATDRVKRNNEIDAARARYNTSARTNYLKAKDQYKVDKLVVGRREAKKALQKVKNKNFEDALISQQAKSGKETTTAILTTVGLAAVLTAAHIVITSRV